MRLSHIAQIILSGMVLLASGLPACSAPKITTSSQSVPAKTPEIAAIESYCQRVDAYTRQHLKAERFIGGNEVYNRKNVSHLRWQTYRTERARLYDAGDDSTFANVWLRGGKIIRVSTERGMASGVGWFENADYYFRDDSTLAKLTFTKSSGAVDKPSTLRQFYNDKGKVIWSSHPATHPLPIYRRTKDLPFYALLHKAKSRK